MNGTEIRRVVVLIKALLLFLQQTANDSLMEEELGLIGASAEDTEAELIRKICETELLAGSTNLILVFCSKAKTIKY